MTLPKKRENFAANVFLCLITAAFFLYSCGTYGKACPQLTGHSDKRVYDESFWHYIETELGGCPIVARKVAGLEAATHEQITLLEKENILFEAWLEYMTLGNYSGKESTLVNRLYGFSVQERMIIGEHPNYLAHLLSFGINGPSVMPNLWKNRNFDKLDKNSNRYWQAIYYANIYDNVLQNANRENVLARMFLTKIRKLDVNEFLELAIFAPKWLDLLLDENVDIYDLLNKRINKQQAPPKLRSELLELTRGNFNSGKLSNDLVFSIIAGLNLFRVSDLLGQQLNQTSNISKAQADYFELTFTNSQGAPSQQTCDDWLSTKLTPPNSKSIDAILASMYGTLPVKKDGETDIDMLAYGACFQDYESEEILAVGIGSLLKMDKFSQWLPNNLKADLVFRDDVKSWIKQNIENQFIPHKRKKQFLKRQLAGVETIQMKRPIFFTKSYWDTLTRFNLLQYLYQIYLVDHKPSHVQSILDRQLMLDQYMGYLAKKGVCRTSNGHPLRSKIIPTLDSLASVTCKDSIPEIQTSLKMVDVQEPSSHWIILHECAHVMLNHGVCSGSPSTKKMEQEADCWALQQLPKISDQLRVVDTDTHHLSNVSSSDRKVLDLISTDIETYGKNSGALYKERMDSLWNCAYEHFGHER